MDSIYDLSNAIWKHEHSQHERQAWIDMAEKISHGPGDTIIKQFHPATHIYFLIEGNIEHSLAFESNKSNISVGQVSDTFFPLGWSGFSQPHRYATTANALSHCSFYRWPISKLTEFFNASPILGQAFFNYCATRVLPLINDTRNKLKSSLYSSELLINSLEKQSYCQLSEFSHADVKEILARSLFMEVMPRELLEDLAKLVEIKYYAPKQALFKAGDSADELMLLANGSIAMSISDSIFLRSYSIPGQVISGPQLCTSGTQEENALSLSNTVVLCMHKDKLAALGQQQPKFSLILERRMLWLLSARLRTLRIQLVAQSYDDEHIVIQHLLSQVSPQLSISSKLYKLPHLLSNRLTHIDALQCLNDVKLNGSTLERTLAGVCLDILSEVAREQAFYDGLHDVYEAVTKAPSDKPTEFSRHLCSQSFKRVFENAHYVIQGVENLPKQSGHIFILNHLISHPYNALANGFEFALDTHFVSAMILDPQYGDSGVRVVRRGRGEEYGHHHYYDRLGHIYVHTAESDRVNAPPDQRQVFNQTASEYLRAGTNLIICPEGTSNWSDESPSEFKKGTFHLAASLDPEPLIVPIVVANFDKRLKSNAFSAVVHPPFYISEVCNPNDKASLNRFLAQLRIDYRQHVDEAIQLAKLKTASPP